MHLLMREPSGAPLPKQPCCPSVPTGQATLAEAEPGHTGSTGSCRGSGRGERNARTLSCKCSAWAAPRTLETGGHT